MGTLEKIVAKQIDNVKKLCTIENYILNNEAAISKDDTEILVLLNNIMDEYTYGWYICEEGFEEQLKSISKFKLFILNFI